MSILSGIHKVEKEVTKEDGRRAENFGKHLAEQYEHQGGGFVEELVSQHCQKLTAKGTQSRCADTDLQVD